MNAAGEEKRRKGVRRPKPPPGDYLTIMETADLLRMSERKVRQLIDDGALLSAKFGQIRIVRRIDVDAFVAAHIKRKAVATVKRGSKAPPTGDA